MLTDPHLTPEGIWGSSPTDVFVGDYESIYHYNGITWSMQSTGSYISIDSIWGSSSTDVFAMGSVFFTSDILHYDGISWSIIPGFDYIILYDIWGCSPTDVFASGTLGSIIRLVCNPVRMLSEKTIVAMLLAFPVLIVLFVPAIKKLMR